MLPVYSYQTFELSGHVPASIFGNDYDNRLIGNDADNLLIGARGADVITGAGGRDTFVLSNLADSLLLDPLTRRTAFDRFLDFAIGTDIIDAPSAIDSSAMIHVKSSAENPSIDLFAGLLPSTILPAFGGSVVELDSGLSTRTFVVLNDGIPGYASAADALFEISGYSGVLADLRII